MNDKELFWSLISPYLVDRPNATNRVSWNIESIMESNDSFVSYDFTRFVLRNHIFQMPSNLRWMRDEFLQLSPSYETLDLEYFQSHHPDSMVITKNKHYGREEVRVYFILDEVILTTKLTPMLNSKTEYVMGHLEPAPNNIVWFSIGRGKYAIVKQNPTFINWNELPWEDLK
tara:strand:+ start:150 stop:665 length:516 start_codon:yes stop_codon:yes gene_type:complete